MKLFGPDNHTPSAAQLVPAPPEDVRRIHDLLRGAYASRFRSPPEVSRIGGPGINSSNFRVGDSYLKILPSTASATVFELPRISGALREGGIPVASFAGNDRGEPITRNADGTFAYLQPFAAADYFPGTKAALGDLLPTLHAFRTALRELDPIPAQREPYASWAPAPILEEVAARVRNPPSEFDRAVADVLPRVHAICAGGGEPPPSGLQHLDLHPHNLLYRNDELAAVIDLESFRVIAYETSVAFALFKLGRKAIVREALDLAGFKRVAGASFDLPALAPFAEREVARRLTVIFELHYLRGDPRWDSDLAKHRAGLEEIRLLFT